MKITLLWNDKKISTSFHCSENLHCLKDDSNTISWLESAFQRFSINIVTCLNSSVIPVLLQFQFNCNSGFNRNFGFTAIFVSLKIRIYCHSSFIAIPVFIAILGFLAIPVNSNSSFNCNSGFTAIPVWFQFRIYCHSSFIAITVLLQF